MTLVSPCCRAALEELRCAACGRVYGAVESVPVLVDEALRASAAFGENDRKYQGGAVPWTYDRTAPEVQKYQLIVETCAALKPSSVLDVGCSLGVLTAKLVEVCGDVTALDLAPSAMVRVTPRATRAVASALALPIADACVDVVVMSDGLVSWKLDEAQKRAAVLEAHRVLKPGGTAIFMEYLKPSRHAELLEPVGAVFPLERVHYLGDRLWYVTESMLRVLRGTAPYDFFAESLGWSSALRAVSGLAGRHGSKHLCVVTRRPGAPSPP